jgi:hypothetical protein
VYVPAVGNNVDFYIDMRLRNLFSSLAAKGVKRIRSAFGLASGETP